MTDDGDEAPDARPRGRRAESGGHGDDPRAGGDRRGPAARPDPAPSPTCDLCGGPVLERHCRIVCLNCGYQRDCSDP